MSSRIAPQAVEEVEMTHAPKLYTDDLAERLKARAGTPYQPSNGHEGEMFMRDWCALCVRDHAFREDPDNADGCEIIADTMALDTSDPDYPNEWQYSAEGQPVCTAFEALSPAVERRGR